MKWLLATLLALALAGCADRGSVDRQMPVELVTSTGHILSLTKPVPRKSLIARAEVSKTHANKSTDNPSLMECVSDACKVQCAPQVEKRPKWCMYFKEPFDRRALSTTSDAPRKSTE